MAEDAPQQDVAQDLAFGARAARALLATPAAVFAQLALSGGSTRQLARAVGKRFQSGVPRKATLCLYNQNTNKLRMCLKYVQKMPLSPNRLVLSRRVAPSDPPFVRAQTHRPTPPQPMPPTTPRLSPVVRTNNAQCSPLSNNLVCSELNALEPFSAWPA